MQKQHKKEVQDWQRVLEEALDLRDLHQSLPFHTLIQDYGIQLETSRLLAQELLQTQQASAQTPRSLLIQLTEEESGMSDDDSEAATLRRQVHRLQQKHLEFHRDKAESVELISRLRGAFSEIEAELALKDAEIEKLKQELAEKSRSGDDQVVITAPTAFQVEFVERFESPRSEDDVI